MNLPRFSGSTCALESTAHIGLDAQRVAVALGLGPLLAIQPCHGYANGCSCERCHRRAKHFVGLCERGVKPLLAARLAQDFTNAVRTDAEMGYV
jgi:hypothetical protein